MFLVNLPTFAVSTGISNHVRWASHFSFVGTVLRKSEYDGHSGDGHAPNNDFSSSGESAPSKSLSLRSNSNIRNCCPRCDSSVLLPGGIFICGCKNSFVISNDSLYPKRRNTAHVVSLRPRWMNKQWRNKNPFKVTASCAMPSGTFFSSTALTSSNTWGWSGALKQRRWKWFNSKSFKSPSPSMSQTLNILTRAFLHLFVS